MPLAQAAANEIPPAENTRYDWLAIRRVAGVVGVAVGPGIGSRSW